MGLISYSQLQDGTEAVANDLNNRFGTIYNEFNGNIDAANLEVIMLADICQLYLVG